MSEREITHSVRLTDEELALLDGKCRPEVQKEVAAALDRLKARELHKDLPPALAGFVADVVNEARKNGRLVYWYTELVHCPLCRKTAGYYRFKKGRRKGQIDPKRPLAFAGRELAFRYVSFEGYPTLGGCVECVESVLPHIREALRGIPVQLPETLRPEGEPKRVKYQRRRCKKCGWEGHEGQMGRLPTMLGDGTYPGKCPSCGEESGLFRDTFETLDGFDVVEVDAS